LNLTDDQKIKMFATMLRIRRFEETIEELVLTGQISGFVHLYIGEEAVATGVCTALAKTDYITSTHRGHGHLIAKGGDVKRMMAEIFGKQTGYCKGKGGSMHIADLDLGILGANGIVGGGPPLATGAGLASWYKGTDTVSVCFFGDGASNQGTTHEAMNLASVLNLPVVFVAENNHFAEFTRQSRHQNIESIAERAAAYGIPGVVVDGNDLLAVYEAALEAVSHAREQKGPTLLECMTYRIKGHFVGDPEAYRQPDEIQPWTGDDKDPIKRFETRLLELNAATPAQIEDIKAAVAKEIKDAVSFAEESPVPGEEELYKDVYAD
jgi:acetoin:2,6-dichlorophenolindophenol oxidoreductase subunit alpha